MNTPTLSRYPRKSVIKTLFVAGVLPLSSTAVTAAPEDDVRVVFNQFVQISYACARRRAIEVTIVEKRRYASIRDRPQDSASGAGAPDSRNACSDGSSRQVRTCRWEMYQSWF